MDSTHAWALSRVASGSLGPDSATQIWLRAHRQSAGVGQFGRTFVSPRGGIYATLVCRWPQPVVAPLTGVAVMLASYMTLCRLAAGQTHRHPHHTPPHHTPPHHTPPHHTPLVKQLRFKWPNDLYGDGRKLAGVLVHSAHDPLGHLFAVISFGLNVNTDPAALPDVCTTLRALTGRPWDLHDLFFALARQIHTTLVQLVMCEQAIVDQAWPLFEGALPVWRPFTLGFGSTP